MITERFGSIVFPSFPWGRIILIYVAGKYDLIFAYRVRGIIRGFQDKLTGGATVGRKFRKFTRINSYGIKVA